MKSSDSPSNSIPQHDYGLALQSAVSWLGDRYLLAAPLNKHSGRKDYFVQPPRWHDGRERGRALSQRSGR